MELIEGTFFSIEGVAISTDVHISEDSSCSLFSTLENPVGKTGEVGKVLKKQMNELYEFFKTSIKWVVQRELKQDKDYLYKFQF